mgnify:FL=1
MKIKIISLYSPSYFNDKRLPAFADKMKFFVMYKKHWWQRYKYMKDMFFRPMKFDSQEAAEEYLKKNGIEIIKVNSLWQRKKNQRKNRQKNLLV